MSSARAFPFSTPGDRRFTVILLIAGAILILFALIFIFLYPLAGLYTEVIPNAIKTKPAWGLIELGVITVDKPLYVVAVIGLHVVYLGALIFAIRQSNKSQVGPNNDTGLARTVLLVGVICALILLWSYPLFSQDVYDYLFHTREWAHYGANPFTHVPSQFSFDPLYAHVSWTEAPSPYGPLWILLTAPLSLIAGNDLFLNLVLFKVLTVVCYAGSAFLLFLMLAKFLPQYSVAGTLLFAWNPLVLMEFGGSGHNDIVMIFFAMLALWLLVNDRFAPALVALTASLLIKIITVVVLPLFIVYVWKKLSARTGDTGSENPKGIIQQPSLGLQFYPSRPSRLANSGALRVLLLYLALCIGITILVYAPLWEGIGSLAFLRRGDIVGGAPVGNVITDLMATFVGHDPAATLWKLIAWGSFGLLILRQTWVVWHGSSHTASLLPGFKQLNAAVAWCVFGPKQVWPAKLTERAPVSVSAAESDLERLARTSMSLLFFYAVVVSQYYQPWYLSWAIMWAAFLLRRRYAVGLWTLLIFGIVAVTGYMYL